MKLRKRKKKISEEHKLGKTIQVTLKDEGHEVLYFDFDWLIGRHIKQNKTKPSQPNIQQSQIEDKSTISYVLASQSLTRNRNI